MEKNYIMGRVESIDLDRFLKDTKHNYRAYNKIPSRVKDIPIMIVKNGKIKEIQPQEYLMDDLNLSHTKLYKQNEEEHQELHYKYKKYSLNKKRVKSTYMGVVGFSKLNLDMDYKNIIKQVELNLKDYCKELGTELQELIFHFDEAGQGHAHFIIKSFNQKGESLRIGKDKTNGSMLQDYLSRSMSVYGIERGEKDSKRKNLSIKEYKDMKDATKQLEETKQQIEQLEQVKNNLLNETQSLQEELNNLKDLLKVETEELEKIRDNLFKEFEELIELDTDGMYNNKIKKTMINMSNKFKYGNITSEMLNKINNTIIKLKNSADKSYNKKPKP